MDDFRRKPVNRIDTAAAVPPAQSATVPPVLTAPENVSAPSPTPASEIPPTPQPIENETGLTPVPVKKPRKKRLLWWLIGLILVAVAALGGVWLWYSSQLAPVNVSDTTKKVVTIKSGSTPTVIASTLKTEGLIRSEDAFLWYTRLTGVQNNLQAGSYRLSPSESTQQVVEHLSKGNVDTFSITFLPGTTVKQQKAVLVKAGYSEGEVEAAFAKSYESPLFEGKPTTADLEGFIYPETYNFSSDASVESILEHTFAEFYSAITKNGLIAKYKSQGLSLYEGITMASIIQKEAIGGDERQIAQVFLKRHKVGMALGSDPTYQYITDKLGVPRDINYDSPYNTRRYPGIPPGPIANAGLTVLKAVGDPAEGDYLYFLSGDDDVTYFSKTFEEHERNIAEHCKVKCQYI